MGIFKEIYCAICGKKTSLLTRLKLTDGNYVCSECQTKLPSYMYDSVSNHYTLEDYKSFLEYSHYSSTVLRPMFHETQHYHTLHIDTENHLFYIGYGIDDDTLILHFHNIDDFDLLFSAEKFKEGIIGDKVQGKVLFKIKMQQPYFYHEKILDYAAKAKAEKKFFGNKVEYENPKGMDDFLLYFHAALASCQDENYYEDEPTVGTSPCSDELHQAMTLFMIDDLNDITLSDLKEQRNRLMKTFHPDKASDDDTKYAQKINSAYDILNQYLK